MMRSMDGRCTNSTMTLIKAFTIALCVPGAILLPSASAVDKEGFCRDLTGLESHIVQGSYALNATNNLILVGTVSVCACSDLDSNEHSFTIDCSVEETYNDDSTFVAFEQMAFELSQGEYLLSETAWGSSYSAFDTTKEISIKREVYYLDDGVMTSCEANACTSCTVCEDKKSIAVNCTYDAQWSLTDECSKGYTGSYVNTFNFGSITGEAVEDDSPSESISTGPSDRVAFCQSLSDLESYMTSRYEEMLGKTYTTTYECGCSELDGTDEQSFTVDCTMEGVDGFMTFFNNDKMTFKLNEGNYELSKTSWKAEDSNGHDDQEEFNLENGVVTSCEVVGCSSCTLCEDGMSIAINCSNLDEGSYTYECDEGYTGSFANTFEFGVITETDAEAEVTTSTTRATEAATTMAATTAVPEPDGESENRDPTDTDNTLNADPSNGALSLCKMGWMASAYGLSLLTLML